MWFHWFGFGTLGRRLALDPGLEEARQNGRRPDADLKTKGRVRVRPKIDPHEKYGSCSGSTGPTRT
ncbi:hypothetical protein TIFTF001_024115 [Ficus carica]|uniref:Uncharacterized protein n=1 Tax=Ficus carica TaxID=3494 RepID=A0AA88AMT1_FICCA|nr:hypothetical protein TIFTF001_024115 [Ficus carica]